MGSNISRREPEVHVVVVQSRENGNVDAKVLRKNYTRVKPSQQRRKIQNRQGKPLVGPDAVPSCIIPYYMLYLTFQSVPPHIFDSMNDALDLPST